METRNFLTKPLRRCRNAGSSFFLSRLWRRHVLSIRVQTWKMRLAHVVRGLFAGLHALALSLTTNRRLYTGLVMIGVVTPLSSCIYQLCDRTEFVDSWYYVNNFYLLLVLGPYLSGLSLTVGVFLLFPENARRSFILIIPAAYLIGKILWLLSCDSNNDFHSTPEWTFFVMGACIALVMLMITDWLTWRWSHRFLAFEARLKLIYDNADEFEPEKVVSMFKTTMREKIEFQKSY